MYLVIKQSCPGAISLSELKQACEVDNELSLVRYDVNSNDWDQRLNNVFEIELCFQDNLLLRGNKIVFPSILKSKILAVAHEGHPGIVAMKT